MSEFVPHWCKTEDDLLRWRYSPERLVMQIRDRLSSLHIGGYEGLEVRCFNREEVDAVQAALTPDELKRIRFVWNEWPSERTPS